MKVKDILEKKPQDTVTAQPQDSIIQTMETLISKKISCLPVLGESGELVGIISDKDIFELVYKKRAQFPDMKVADVMTSDLIVGLPEDDLSYIASIMTENRVRHIPIVNGQKLIGLISQGDIVKGEMVKIRVENRYLKEYINGNYPA